MIQNRARTHFLLGGYSVSIGTTSVCWCAALKNTCRYMAAAATSFPNGAPGKCESATLFRGKERPILLSVCVCLGGLILFLADNSQVKYISFDKSALRYIQ